MAEEMKTEELQAAEKLFADATRVLAEMRELKSRGKINNPAALADQVVNNVMPLLLDALQANVELQQQLDEFAADVSDALDVEHDDDESRLAPEDAATLAGVIKDYRLVMEGSLSNANLEQMQRAQQLISQIDEALQLIDQVTVVDDDEDEDDEDDEESAPDSGVTVTPTEAEPAVAPTEPPPPEPAAEPAAAEQEPDTEPATSET
jgi:hypothetical protein